jgi:TRAP-type C4-dicarboxylate transport system permease small subunit
MIWLFKSEDVLVKFEKAVVAVLVVLMVALSFLQLVLRLAFHSSILWLDPLLRHFVLWAGFLGAALAARESRHFALDIAHEMMPQWLRRPAAILGACFACVVCAFMVYAGISFIKDEIASGSAAFDIGSWSVKGWWLELILPVGFALILFHTAVGLLRPAKEVK